MTSILALELAQQVIQNDMSVVDPLVKLLHAFMASRGDPLGEAMMSDVVGFLYTKTSHCEAGLLRFVSEAEPAETSLAA